MSARVYDCKSSREFIEKTYLSVRQENPTLTIERYASRLGIGGSSLKMILSGKRKPTVHQILCFAKAQRLSSAETSYLEILALSESAQNKWEETYYSTALKKKASEIKLSRISTANKDLLSDTLALPLLVDLMDRQSDGIDPKSIASRFGVSIERIEKLIELFQVKKLLEKSENGCFHVAFDKLNYRGAQKKYLKNLLSESAQRLEKDYERPDTLFVGYSFSATTDSLLRLQMEIKGIMEKYMAVGPIADGDRIVTQACFQIYPITKLENQ